jgi:coenzyme F420 hydrogenase subunit beta
MPEKEDVRKDEEELSFSDLMREVHEKGICGQCGGCVSFCSADDLGALGYDEEGTPIYANESECGICFLICPNIHVLDSDLRERFDWKPPIGNFLKVVSARSTDTDILKNCTDGGVVTGLLSYLIEKRVIDGAIVSRRTGPFSSEPFIANSYDDLLLSAGSRFKETQEKGMEELGNFTTYSRTISTFKDVKRSDMLRLAVVGTPCQVETIRKMQVLGITPVHVVKLVIGLFCTAMFSFTKLAKKKLEKSFGIRIEDITKVNIKEALQVTTKDGKVHSIPIEELDEFIRPACKVCPNYTNDFADISVGGLGSPDGYTSVIIRTSIGEKRFQEAVDAGHIEMLKHDDHRTASVERSKMLGKIISAGKKKREEGERKRNEVRRRGGSR